MLATATPHYEYRVITMPRGMSLTDSRQRLTAEAEQGHWELARTLVYTGGVRKYWLRRKTLRVESTLVTSVWP